MDNNLIVGRDCSLITIASIIKKSTLIQNNWSTLARRLNVSNIQVKTLRQNLLLNIITFEDLIFEVLETWIGINGGNATLSNLLEVVEGHCEANDVGELLRLEYKLPCKLADSNHSKSKIHTPPTDYPQQSSLNFQEAKCPDHWRKPTSSEPSKVLTTPTPDYHSYFNPNGAESGALRKGAGSQSSNPIESTSPGMLRRGATAVGSAVVGVCVSAKDRLFKGSSVGASDHIEKAEMATQPICTVLSSALSSLLTSQYKYQHHAVFYTSSRKPLPDQGGKSWDQNYVKMPYSPFKGGGLQKWNLILEELTMLKSLLDFQCQNAPIGPALANSIKAYSDSSRDTNFRVLDLPEISQRLRKTLPIILAYALQLPNLLGEEIPYLKQGSGKTIYVTRRLACSLLAHGFLCTIPHEMRPDDMPNFHFENLFHKDQDAPCRIQSKLEKLKCILEYFDQIANISPEEGDSIISFERRCIPQQQDWNGSKVNLCDFSCNSQTGLETAKDMLQVVLANQCVGEGIFSDGIMEEIRFVLSPELLLSCLFTEPLQDDEALIVTGTKQFTTYSGCGPTFRYVNRMNAIPSGKDSFGREYCQVVAMDALQFIRNRNQFKKKNIDRELHKCYVGFSNRERYLAPVATENGDCVVFNEDKELKILLQWMAASMAGRPRIAFYTSVEQSNSIEEFGRVQQVRNVRVGKLYQLLMKYESLGTSNESNRPLSVFQFILNEI